MEAMEYSSINDYFRQPQSKISGAGGNIAENEPHKDIRNSFSRNNCNNCTNENVKKLQDLHNIQKTEEKLLRSNGCTTCGVPLTQDALTESFQKNKETLSSKDNHSDNVRQIIMNYAATQLSLLRAKKPVQTNVGEDRQHELPYTWMLWYSDLNDKTSFAESQQQIGKISTVEEFWQLQHFLVSPTCLTPFKGYAIFKRGIKPLWEDESNRHGGRVFCHKGYNGNKEQIDTIWVFLALNVLGNLYENLDAVCGFMIKQCEHKCVFSVWISDGRNNHLIEDLRTWLSNIIMAPRHRVLFELHTDAILLG